MPMRRHARIFHKCLWDGLGDKPWRDRQEPPRRGRTRKTAAPGPGSAAPSSSAPSRTALGRRNHARRLSSTDFCNTIGTSPKCHLWRVRAACGAIVDSGLRVRPVPEPPRVGGDGAGDQPRHASAPRRADRTQTPAAGRNSGSWPRRAPAHGLVAIVAW